MNTIRHWLQEVKAEVAHDTESIDDPLAGLRVTLETAYHDPHTVDTGVVYSRSQGLRTSAPR